MTRRREGRQLAFALLTVLHHLEEDSSSDDLAVLLPEVQRFGDVVAMELATMLLAVWRQSVGDTEQALQVVAAHMLADDGDAP